MKKLKTIGGAAVIGAGLVGGLMKGLFFSASQKAKNSLALMWGSGDYTGDGLVSLGDIPKLTACWWGPKLNPAGYECWSDTTCGVFDLEKDCDIDMADYVEWLNKFESDQ